MRRQRMWHQLALTWCAAVTLSGCTKWSGPTGPVPELFQQSRVWEARVTMRDSTAPLVLKNPVLTADSLVGTGGGGRRVAVGIADVREVTVRKSDVVRTSALMIGGLVAAVGAFAWLLEMSYGGAHT